MCTSINYIADNNGVFDSDVVSGDRVEGVAPWESTDTVSASGEKRRIRYQLQDRLLELLPRDARECACHRVSSKSGASIVLNDQGSARYRGVYRCGNVWVCPLCAPVIAASRSEKVGAVLRWGTAEGFTFLKLALTCRHQLSDELDHILKKQVEALRSFKSCRAVREIRKEIGYVDSITAKETTWGGKSGWHPHQHEYWMCKLPEDFDLKVVEQKLSVEWLKALKRKGLDGAMGVALHMGVMKKDEIEKGAASGYLSKSGTAAGYLTKSGTAAALELAGGVFKGGGKKPHKQGHYTPMELLAMGVDWADSLFMEFYEAFKDRKQLTFGRVILVTYGDRFGTFPGPNCEVMELEDREKPDEHEVIKLGPRQLFALRRYRKAVCVLELVEAGFLDEAKELICNVWDRYQDELYRRAVDRLRQQGVFL